MDEPRAHRHKSFRPWPRREADESHSINSEEGILARLA